MTNQPERDAPCMRCDHEYSRHPYGASPGRPGLACSEFVPEIGEATACRRCLHSSQQHATSPNSTACLAPECGCAAFADRPPGSAWARPCACGHLSNRHNALVSGRCRHLGCDCPDFREPEPEHPITTTGLGIRRSLPITRVVVDREMFEQLSAELDQYRRVLSIALDTERELSHAELRAYAADAIRYARTLPPPVRSGETVTVAEVSSGSPDAGPCGADYGEVHSKREDEAAAWAGDSPEWTV